MEAVTQSALNLKTNATKITLHNYIISIIYLLLLKRKHNNLTKEFYNAY